MLKIFQKVLAVCFFLLSLCNLFPQEEITKKYFYNIFGGGREKIIYGKENDIKIEELNINIYLYNTHARINAEYIISNNGNDSAINFYYPKVDAKIKVLENENPKIREEIIKGDYINFSAAVDNKTINYNIVENFSDKEVILMPFKIGNEIHRINPKNRKKEDSVPDSYKFYYSWYNFSVDLAKKEHKKIIISYETPLYYNEITAKNLTRDLNGDMEDPALNYVKNYNNDVLFLRSERIFTYFLTLPQNLNPLEIEKVYINLNANVINYNDLKVLPLNFKKSKNNYIWKYKNFNPREINNIVISVFSAAGEKDSFVAYKTNIEKKKSDYKEYFELSKLKDELVLELNKKNQANALIKKIKFSPLSFDDKAEIKNTNLPSEVEISFSNDKSFNNSVKFTKIVGERKLPRILGKYSGVEIFTSKKGIEAKYIKIRILNTTKDEEKVLIGNISVSE